MTDDEKKVLKQLGKMISDLIYLKGVYEAVLKKRVNDWKDEIEAANASSDFHIIASVANGNWIAGLNITRLMLESVKRLMACWVSLTM